MPCRRTAVKLTEQPGFVRFWVASTVSDFGTYITTIAISVIAVLELDASSTEVGLVRAVRWLPYPFFGLLAGVWVDRHSHKPLLIATDIGRALLLAAMATLSFAGWLTIPWLLSLLFAFGLLSLAGDAAFQAVTTVLVPRELLVRANARIEQSDSVAQTTGPALAGWLIQILTAPAALLIDAASYVISAVVVATIPLRTSDTPRLETGTVGGQVREGLAWVYRHPRLGPLALTTHLWFIFFSMFGTVFTVFALRERELGADGLGIVLALSGVGAVVGSLLTTRVGEALGTGRTIIYSRCLYPVAFAIIACAGFATVGSLPSVAIFGAGQALIGLALGLEGAQEMGYQQAVTPVRLIGRMAATVRSLNRGVVVVGAPLGGILAGAIGNRPTLLVCAGGMIVVVLLMALSDLRNARMEDQLSDDVASQ